MRRPAMRCKKCGKPFRKGDYIYEWNWARLGAVVDDVRHAETLMRIREHVSCSKSVSEDQAMVFQEALTELSRRNDQVRRLLARLSKESGEL